MVVAETELRRAGWSDVVRTAESASWDYEVTYDGGDAARVEVKGSTLPIWTIEVTRNERDSAVTFPHSILILVSDIDLDRSVPRATAATPRVIDPWTPTPDDFVPEHYTYRLPSESASGGAG